MKQGLAKIEGVSGSPVFGRARRQAARLVIAVFLIQGLFAGLMPVVGAGGASASSKIWISICTSAGIRTIALGLDGLPDESQDPSESGFCPLCMPMNAGAVPAPEFAFAGPADLDATTCRGTVAVDVKHARIRVNGLAGPRAPPIIA